MSIYFPYSPFSLFWMKVYKVQDYSPGECPWPADLGMLLVFEWSKDSIVGQDPYALHTQIVKIKDTCTALQLPYIFPFLSAFTKRNGTCHTYWYSSVFCTCFQHLQTPPQITPGKFVRPPRLLWLFVFHQCCQSHPYLRHRCRSNSARWCAMFMACVL